MKKYYACFIGLMVILSVAATTTLWGQEVIKIGMLAPATGPAADIGEPLILGAKLAIEEINASGGVPCGSAKKKIDVLVVDDENSPAKSVSGAQRLINKDNVAVILGPAGSGCALAVRQVANPAKVVMVTPAINDTIIGPDMPFIFRSACNWSDQVFGLVDFTTNRYKKFAILHDTSGLGQGGATEFKKALAKRGITPVAEEKYEVNTLNLMPQVTRIKNAGAEFIFLCAVGADVITVGKLMKQIGYDVPVGGNNGLGMRVTLKAADKLEGWVFTDTVDGNKPQFKEFLKKFVARYKTTPTYHPAAQGYDAIYAIVKGLERTSGNGGEALVQAFKQGISIDGATCKTGTSFHWNKDRAVAIDATQLSLWKIHNGDYEMFK